MRPRFACWFRPGKWRAQGKPGARCTRSLACKNKKHDELVTTGSPGTPGLPCAMVLTAYSALSSATNSSCHRRQRIKAGRTRSGRIRLRRLDTSNGCQDHTALPSATTSVVVARYSRSRKTALQPLTRPTLLRPPHPAPNVRDDRDTPLLWGRDGKHLH